MVNRFIKIMNYKQIKTNIDQAVLAKIIIYIMVMDYNLLNSIISNIGALFLSKF